MLEQYKKYNKYWWSGSM